MQIILGATDRQNKKSSKRNSEASVTFEEITGTLISKGHSYNNIVDVYSFERCFLYYYLVIKSDLTYQMIQTNTLVTAMATCWAEKGGQQMATQMKKIERQIKVIDKTIEGILAHKTVKEVSNAISEDVLDTLSQIGADTSLPKRLKKK